MQVARKINERDDLYATRIQTLEEGEEVWRCEYIKERLPFYAICRNGFELYTSKPGSGNHTMGLRDALAAYRDLKTSSKRA